MRALRLDYCARPAAVFVGKIVLVSGIVVLSLVAFEYYRVQQELSVEESRTADVRKAAKRAATSVRSGPRELQATARELELAQRALQRLSLRWHELFSALESARADGVALLAIEPDPGKSVVKLTAEARTADDMLNYVERLQAAPGLADVRLTSHQVKATDPLQPMRFVVLASWINQR